MVAVHGLGTVRGAKQRCLALREQLLAAPHLCTPAEVEEYWPGGAENKLTGLAGWVYCYAQFSRLWGRDELLTRQGEGDTRRQALEHALAGAPESVPLDATDEFGVHHTTLVYPKSFVALTHAMERDIVLKWLAEKYTELEQVETPTAGALQGQILIEMGYQHRVLVWLVSEPTVIPWPERETRPDPPAWTGELSALDIVRIVQAHRRVNGTHLQVVAALLGMSGESGSGDPLSWGTLVAGIAKDFGVSSRHLMRDEPIVALVTQVMINHHEAAKQSAAAQKSTRGPVAPAMVG